MKKSSNYGIIVVMGDKLKTEVENKFNEGKSMKMIEDTKIFHISNEEERRCFNIWYIEENKFDLTSAFFTLTLISQSSTSILFLYESNEEMKDEFSKHIVSILKEKENFIFKDLSKENGKQDLFQFSGIEISPDASSLLKKIQEEKKYKDVDDMLMDMEKMKEWEEVGNSQEKLEKDLLELQKTGNIYLLSSENLIFLSCNCLIKYLYTFFYSNDIGDPYEDELWEKLKETKGLYTNEYIETAVPHKKWIKELLFNTNAAFPLQTSEDKSNCDVIIPSKWSEELPDDASNGFKKLEKTVKWEYYFKKPPVYLFNQLFSILYGLYKDENIVYSNALVLKWKEHDKEAFVLVKKGRKDGISIEATSDSLDYTWRSFIRVGREIEFFLKKSKSNVIVNKYAIDSLDKGHKIVDLLNEDTRDPLLLPFTMKWFDTPEIYENVLICTNEGCKSRIGSGVRKMICENYPYCQKRTYCFRCGVLDAIEVKRDCCGKNMTWKRMNKEGEFEILSEEAIKSGKNCITNDALYKVMDKLKNTKENGFKNQLPKMLKLMDENTILLDDEKKGKEEDKNIKSSHEEMKRLKVMENSINSSNEELKETDKNEEESKSDEEKKRPLIEVGFMKRAKDYSLRLKNDINEICHRIWAKEFKIVFKEESTIIQKLKKRKKELNDFIRTRILVETFLQLENFIKELEKKGYFWYFKPPRPNYFQHVVYIFVFTSNDANKIHFPMEIQFMNQVMFEDINGMDNHDEYEDEREAKKDTK